MEQLSEQCEINKLLLNEFEEIFKTDEMKQLIEKHNYQDDIDKNINTMKSCFHDASEIVDTNECLELIKRLTEANHNLIHYVELLFSESN